MIGNGATQMEVAKAQKCNQSSVAKSLKGSVVYGEHGRESFGGSENKLRDACFADPKIISILAKIDEIREEKW
jgi:hypothetical protein